jgi:predicted DNA-binding transcriptional regulator AlpA
MAQPKLLITPNALATLLGVSRQRISQLIAADKLPPPQLWDGRRRAWLFEDALAWMPTEQRVADALRGSVIQYAYVAVPTPRARKRKGKQS